MKTIWDLPREDRLNIIRDQATIEILTEQDHASVRGNALASGDDDEDRAAEDEILERLEHGDIWAWAAVQVRATWQGITASDYLGCCSYRDEEDFREDGYYFDMVATCIEDIEAAALEIVTAAA
jgi:hypothetical protein